MFGLAQPLAAQAAPLQENRYLLMIDISKSMQDRAPGTLKAVEELLQSGMDGQIREGDSIALWTFNDQLYAGRFPNHRWFAADQGAIASRVLNFLEGQKYVKTANLDALLAPMDYVVQDSQFVTLILITDGEHKLRGTPFDDAINGFCARLAKKQQKAHMPFAIVLRAVKGQITEYAVSTAPRPIRIPVVPAPVQLTRTAPSAPPPVVEQPHQVPAGALVFSGSDPKPVATLRPVETSAPKPPATKPELPAPIPPKKTVNAEVSFPPPATSEENWAAIAEIAPAIVPLPDEVALQAAVSSPPQAEPPKLVPAVRNEPPKPVSPPVVVKPEVPPAAPVASAISLAPTTGAATLVRAPVPPPESPKEPNAKPAPSEPVKVAVAPVAPVPPQAEPAIPKSVRPEASAKPAPSLRPPVTNATPAVAAMTPTTHGLEGCADTPAVLEGPPPKAQSAVRSPAPSSPQGALGGPSEWFSSRWPFWAALALTGVVITCSLLLVRRSRTAPTASLITCSLERNKRG